MNVKYWAERRREWTSGEVRGRDDVAVRFARESFEVALERTQAS